MGDSDTTDGKPSNQPQTPPDNVLPLRPRRRRNPGPPRFDPTRTDDGLTRIWFSLSVPLAAVAAAMSGDVHAWGHCPVCDAKVPIPVTESGRPACRELPCGHLPPWVDAFDLETRVQNTLDRLQVRRLDAMVRLARSREGAVGPHYAAEREVGGYLVATWEGRRVPYLHETAQDAVRAAEQRIGEELHPVVRTLAIMDINRRLTEAEYAYDLRRGLDTGEADVYHDHPEGSVRAVSFPDVGDVMMLRAPLASGKTEWAAHLADFVSRGGVVAITHRISLTMSLARRLRLGFYRDDARQLVEQTGLALCVNSLCVPRLQERLDKAHTVVVDEARAVMDAIASGANMSDPAAIYRRLLTLLAKAERVVLLDADLDREDLYLWRGFAQRYGKRLVVHNVLPTQAWVAPDGTEFQAEVEYTKDIGGVVDAVLDALAAGEPCYFTSDYKSSAKAFELIGKDAGARTLLVTAETVDDPAVRAFMARPDDEATKYDLVCASPAIASGLSLTGGHLKRVVALFHGQLSAVDMAQMLRRVRTAGHIVVGFEERGIHGIEPLDPRVWRAGLTDLIQADAGEGAPLLDYDYFRTQRRAHMHWAARSGLRSLPWLIAREWRGYESYHRREEMPEERDPRLIEALGQARRQGLRDVLGAGNISRAEYQRLHDEQVARTPEVWPAVLRHRIMRDLALLEEREGGKPEGVLSEGDVVRWRRLRRGALGRADALLSPWLPREETLSGQALSVRKYRRWAASIGRKVLLALDIDPLDCSDQRLDPRAVHKAYGLLVDHWRPLAASGLLRLKGARVDASGHVDERRIHRSNDPGEAVKALLAGFGLRLTGSLKGRGGRSTLTVDGRHLLWLLQAVARRGHRKFAGPGATPAPRRRGRPSTVHQRLAGLVVLVGEEVVPLAPAWLSAHTDMKKRAAQEWSKRIRKSPPAGWRIFEFVVEAGVLAGNRVFVLSKGENRENAGAVAGKLLLCKLK